MIGEFAQNAVGELGLTDSFNSNVTAKPYQLASAGLGLAATNTFLEPVSTFDF